MLIDHPFSHALIFGAAVAATVAYAPMAPAQTGNFELELNSSADTPEGCQLTFVATNNTDVALTKASFEVAVFNGEGLASSLFVFEFGELPLNKTRVVMFSMPAVSCPDVSRLLVNRQDECESEKGVEQICMKALNASSRVQSIPFGL